MGRHRKAADVITLPPLGRSGDPLPEAQRVANILARDTADAERDTRRLKHQYNDQPANLRNYEALDVDKTVGERRYRALPADHALVRLFVKKKIPESEFNPGNIYRIIFERAHDPAGRDSTAAMLISASKSGDGTPAFHTDMGKCRDCLANLHSRMGTVDGEIVRLLCGLGVSVADAVNFAVQCVPSGRILRARESLRALRSAMDKVMLPEIAPELLYPRQSAAE